MENLDSYGKVWKRSGVAFWFCFIEQKSVGVERPIFKTMTDYFIVQNCFKAESRGACTFGKINEVMLALRSGGRIVSILPYLAIGQVEY